MRRQGVWLCAALACWAEPLWAERDDPTLGQEFRDQPEQPHAAPAEQVAPSADEKKEPGYLPGYRRGTGVGLSPHAPQRSPALPGALTPAFGSAVRGRDFRFGFTGYLQAGLRAGIGKRDRALEGQKKLVLHADPVVPGASYGWFDHNNTVPYPWAQLNFSYGNEEVQATVIIGAWSFGVAQEASGYIQVPSRLWLSDAFLSYTPDTGPVDLRLNVGVYNERYGAMAEYHEGAYSASLIGAVAGMGTTASVLLPLEGDIDLRTEVGIKGDFNRAPVGISPNASNEFARPEEGSTYAAHAHVGATYSQITPTLHYIYSWSQDDRSDPADDPNTPANDSQLRKDGSLDIKGVDVRVDADRFGYLYLGASRVTGEHTRSISNLVQVLNSGSGKEFMERFWSHASGGNGTLTLFGAQYTLSLGTLLRYPNEFWGDGPDLTASVFGIYGQSDSAVDAFDRNMLKYGTEWVYSFDKHLAVAMRLDHVRPDLADESRSFFVISPKVILRTDWITREAVTLQYSGYLLGDGVVVNGDNRLVNTNSDNPDQHMVSVFATMWW